MDIKRVSRVPKLTLHKPSGRGYLRLNGRCIYLGKYDDPATHERAHRMLAEWLANGRRLPVAPDEITLAEILAAYWNHCQEVYRRPDDSPSERTLGGIRSAMNIPLKLYGECNAVEFGPLALRACREIWIDNGIRRTTVNKHTGIIKRTFRWAASLEMIPVAAFEALNTVEGLRKGRSRAKESREVHPVPKDHIAAIQPKVSRQVWGLVQLQLFTGARSGEILKLRRYDLDTSADVWTATLSDHKTAYCGRDRVLYFGERAQAVLLEFFDGKGPFDYLFSPQDAEQERYARCESHRHQPVAKPKTDRKVGEHYTSDSYRKAIERGCKAAMVPVWHPHRLRHTCATDLRRQHGLDAAAVFLGHAHANVTQTYAELDAAKAVEIARQAG